MSKTIPTIIQDIDELPEEELTSRFDQTIAHLDAIRVLWPGLFRLDEGQRNSSPGKSLSVFADPLHKLFNVLKPKDGKAPEIAKYFDALGDEDFGIDPEKFESELLARRLIRVEFEQKVVAVLTDLLRHFGDDALYTGAQVVVPGLLALEMARTLSKTNATFRSLLAPVLDALREMTKAARAGAADARAAKKAGGGDMPPPAK